MISQPGPASVLTKVRSEYDIDTIADEVIAFHDAYDAEKNVYWLSSQHYTIEETSEDFILANRYAEEKE